MTFKLIGVVLATWCSGFVVATAGPQAQQVQPTGQYKPPPAPEQPIAFSHKQHVAQRLTCGECHKGDANGYATLPPNATCIRCHPTTAANTPELKKLGALVAVSEIPWKRVYRLPDWVYFSHTVHASGTPPMTCNTCHGDVGQMDAAQKVKDISMDTCVQCHKERAAPNQCDSCHELKG